MSSIKGFFRKFSFRESFKKGPRESDEGFNNTRPSDDSTRPSDTSEIDPRLSLDPRTAIEVNTTSPMVREPSSINVTANETSISQEDENMLAIERKRIQEEKEKRGSEVTKKLSASKKKKMIAEMENLRAKTLNQRSTANDPLRGSKSSDMNRSVPLIEAAELINNDGQKCVESELRPKPAESAKPTECAISNELSAHGHPESLIPEFGPSKAFMKTESHKKSEEAVKTIPIHIPELERQNEVTPSKVFELSASSIGPTSQDLSPRHQEILNGGNAFSIASNSQRDLQNLSQPNIDSMPLDSTEFKLSNRPSVNKSLSYAFPRRYDYNEKEDGKSHTRNFWDKESEADSSILSEDDISHHDLVMTSHERPGAVSQFKDLKKYMSQSMVFPDKINRIEILNKSDGMEPSTEKMNVKDEIQNLKLRQHPMQLEDHKEEVEEFSYSSGGLVQESLPVMEPGVAEIPAEIPEELNQVAYFKSLGHDESRIAPPLEETPIRRESEYVDPFGPYTVGKIQKRRTSTMEKVTTIKRDQQKKRLTQGPAQKYHMNEPTFAQHLQRMKKRDSLKPRVKEPEVKPVKIRTDRTMDHWVFKNLNSAGLEKKTQKSELKLVKEEEEHTLQQGPAAENGVPSNGVFVLDGGKYGAFAIKDADEKKMQGLLSRSAKIDQKNETKEHNDNAHVVPETKNLLPQPQENMIIEGPKDPKFLDASPTAQQILPDPVQEAATYFHDKFIEKEEKVVQNEKGKPQNKKSIVSSGSSSSVLEKDESVKEEDDRVMLQSFASVLGNGGQARNNGRMKTVGELDDSYANYYLMHKL